MRNVDGVAEALKIADSIAEEDYEMLRRLATGIREMTAGERQASVDREKVNNLDKKI
ncbi:hypothetical protein CRP227_gp49 [Roseobacter phage CRP-227]|uniref:Uncharacterized protein n=1 Tax=Roseobacter phage CRP-227 TaxID=3072847 RepID=A0AAX3ZXY1_9CAUD|nr:hypothetical protein CRP227_gp49 [Roseobacter phage CRP-227]